ncbi:hypothetical protein NQ315_006092 [Exocentrus adspersus]|uniref:HAT C-terminal dimerisation domain-containing protein n=1 Tax=Exocentrus adspersus TaxID=1586481 RepID=A0AAV8VEC1_9CUCU|nr:hypothetical protein NQ315_006092 [Exocentrus adspersus]
MLQDLLDQWKLNKDQIHLLLADNAANMKKGIAGAGIKFEGCFIHTLQLTIKDFIDCQRAVVGDNGTCTIETISDDSDEAEDNVPLKLLKKDCTESEMVHNLFWASYEHFAGDGASGSKRKRKHKKNSFAEQLEDEIKLYQNDSAAIYLSPPAGSITSEQVFSEAGNIYDAKCSRLTPDWAESLLFLHHNLPKLNYQY